MRSTSTVLGVVAAVVAALSFVMFQSCGKKSGGGGDDSDTLDNSTTQTTTVADAAAPAAATLADGSGLTVPAGVIPVGGTLSVQTIDAPADIALADLTGASSTLKFEATDASGAAITELSQPGTLAIMITPAAALAAIDPVDANLCAVGLALDGSKLVWRRGVLSAVSATTASFLTKFLGSFRLLYCGDSKLDGFAEMAADGTKAPAPVTEASLIAGLGACHRQADHSCVLVVGKDAKSNLAAFKEEKCLNEAGAVYLDDGCPSDGVIGFCLERFGTVKEAADVLYTGSKVTKASCEAQGDDFSYFAAGKYTPTPAAKQVVTEEQQPITSICGHDLKPSCNDPTNDKCTMYIGTNIVGATLDSREASCTGPNEWLPDACATSPEPLGCCLINVSPGYEELIVMWQNAGDRTSLAPAYVECSALAGTLYLPDGTPYTGP